MSHETRHLIVQRIAAIEQAITKLHEKLNIMPSQNVRRALITAKRRRASLRGRLTKFDARTKNE